MERNVISVKYPPLIDPTRTPIAYGREAFHQINIKLESSNITTQHRALRSLSDIVHDPENAYVSLKLDLGKKLANFLLHKDNVLRSLSIQCLFTISGHDCGREFIIYNNLIPRIAKLVDKSEFENIRKLAHGTFQRISQHPMGPDKLIQFGMIAKFVNQAEAEIDEIKVVVLETLNNCLYVDTSIALEHNSIQIFLVLLGSQIPTIRYKAARNLMNLAVSFDGKNKAVDQGSIPVLLNLLQDPNEDVRAHGCGALMLLVVITKGKYAAVENDAVNRLLPLLEDKSDHVKTNALRCLTCLAEVPPMREMLLGHLDGITRLIEEGTPHVSKVAKTAKKVIQWTP